MKQCPCGSEIDYSDCCGVYLSDEQIPASPEAMMRSRYTAYSLANIAYISNTMRGKPLIGFVEVVARSWAERVIWLGLKIIAVRIGTPDQGYVEFIARYLEGEQLKSICEISEFHRLDGKWFYVDGLHPDSKKEKKQTVRRNSPCPCGSLKKFKNCHGNLVN